MTYYSTRTGKSITNENEFHKRLVAILNDFFVRDYFKEKLKLYKLSKENEYVNTKSTGNIGIRVYPFDSWSNDLITKDNLFDTIEFFFKYISKPGEYGYKTDHTNWSYEDYLDYNSADGKNEFRSEVNILLGSYCEGYELNENGMILYLGDETSNFIDTDFPEYNDDNIDSVIHLAIKQWKNKNQSSDEKKQAIIKLANVFEYLKKEKSLESVLKQKDTSDLFQIANSFSLRHHNPNQKNDYDKEIWYDWIFQFYLATCIATLKMIKKNKP
jgi:hypothetical protein